MTKQDTFLSAGQHDRHVRAGVVERVLNASIVRADIRAGFEEYLEIFDAFYAEDVEASSGTGEEPIRGKARVRSLLLNFLVPLHLMAEVGGLLITVRHNLVPGDVADETHSEWTLELAGVSGKTCTLSWRTFRKWQGPLVIYEHHYDHRQSGGPLTSDDLSFDAANLGDWSPEPSKIAS